MNVAIGGVLLAVALLELLAITIELFGWRKEPAAVRWRRAMLHVGASVLVIGGFLAIVHFGPLRPVHEWIR
jgi:hypothetical protein